MGRLWMGMFHLIQTKGLNILLIGGGLILGSCLLTPFVFSPFIQFPPLAMADTSPSSLPEVNQYDPICGAVLPSSGTMASSATPLPSPLPPALLQYCQSAKSEIDAANANAAMWKVWAAVAGVCVAACAASFAGIGNQFICIGFSSAAGIADAVVTKNFTSALMALGGGAGAYFTNYAMAPKAEPRAAGATGPAKEVEKGKDIGACILSGIAGFQIYTDYNHMQTNNSSAQTNLASALALENTIAPALTVTPQVAPAPDATPTATTYSTAVGNAAAPIANPTASSGTAQLCSQANSTGNGNMIVSCASASDSNLPGYVNTPRFANDFNKASGMNLGDFLSKSNSPTGAFMTAAGGTLNSDQSGLFAAAVKNMEQHIPLPNSAYAGGGSSGAGKNGGGDTAFGDAFAGLMGQFGPKKDENPAQNNLASIAFANQHQSAVTIPEDRNLSIFDRISYRYFSIGRRLIEEGR